MDRAIANVATVVLATVASLVGFRVYKIESRRDQRAEEERQVRAADERRSQAAKVYVWYGQNPDAVEASKARLARLPMNTGFVTQPSELYRAHIVNASDLPIYAVLVRFQLPGTPRRAAAYWADFPVRVVPPHQEPTTVPPPRAMTRALAAQHLTELEVSVAFRDSAGHGWYRDKDGVLIEVPPGRRIPRL
ncbi:hypothetical protein JNW90_00910 [Micromonospora sp. STR1s_5]|nr:hypothetical protein [Micromonospora sp. STR1s_5]